MQWRQLSVKALFEIRILSWQSVYYYRKWCLSSVWQGCWIELLRKNKKYLDLSSVDLDGSHTPAVRGGQDVEYQGRKKRKTTNALYFTHKQGLPLAMLEFVAGHHNDLYNIEVQFEIVTATLENTDIQPVGLFLNVDAGFDSKEFRKACNLKQINANVCLTNVTAIQIEINI
ncbi:hypothetical protein [Aquimarina aggregata]|uniref:hypothetical protein n=1 Tax=Aquimarina aggregata TaxID=1642818 RepID=UPI002492EDD2|nr:hypothetical protein [Aquimarina aggregata]